MSKKYKIRQYSTTKPNIDLSILSIDQIKIRLAELEPEYKGETRRCKVCGKEQMITEYYPKYADKEHKIIKSRRWTCRDCLLRRMKVKEVGKIRFAKKILHKHFRRCSICKEIKPLTEFKKSKNSYGGYSNNCYPCQHKLNHDFFQKQKNGIGDFYIKEYGYRQGITRGSEIDSQTMDRLRIEIIKSRKPKYFTDGKEFYDLQEFARYINKIYHIPHYTVEKRIQTGATEQDCKIPENFYRSLNNNKGQVCVIDIITDEKWTFCHSSHPELLAMFNRNTITQAIKTGKPTRITSLSKYKNPCIIQRIK